jgi:hypothetical protein
MIDELARLRNLDPVGTNEIYANRTRKAKEK